MRLHSDDPYSDRNGLRIRTKAIDSTKQRSGVGSGLGSFAESAQCVHPRELGLRNKHTGRLASAQGSPGFAAYRPAQACPKSVCDNRMWLGTLAQSRLFCRACAFAVSRFPNEFAGS
jgi:hypothetical protein